MKYTIESAYILIELDRTSIVDISPGDQLESPNLNAKYMWSEQDMQFLESNPDARLFVKFEKSGSSFEGKGLVIVPEEVY
jgi:hypothetical protein